MSNRTTVIIGAGAVLDFDFEGITFPSTSNITSIVSKLIVQGLDSSQSNIIPTIFNELNSRVNEVYIRRGLPMLNYSVNFEELFFAIECLSSINSIYNNRNNRNNQAGCCRCAINRFKYSKSQKADGWRA